MRMTFLGTAAANAFPESFCRCANCMAARAEGGRSLRKRSSALVNSDLLIDLRPDIHSSAQQHAIDLTGVRYCLQTHPHADHMDLSHLLSRSPGFGVVAAPRLHFYASHPALEHAEQTFRRDLSELELLSPEAADELNATINALSPYQPTQIGDYQVIAFPANHDPACGAMLYAVRANGKALFYATDTAALLDETWRSFREFKLAFDLVVLDHTYGPLEETSDHLSARDVAAHVKRMREEGFLAPQGRALATHIAHEGNPPHSALSEYARNLAYEIAYDGLVVDF